MGHNFFKGLKRELSPVGKEIKNDLSHGKKLHKNLQINKRRFEPQNLNPSPRMITKEQGLLQEMFNGDKFWGTGQNLPQLNNSLNSGGGIIKSGDHNGSTGMFFGLK